MMHTTTAVLLLAAVAEAQLPSFQATKSQLPSFQAQHHDALTGRGRPLLDAFIRGHRDSFSIKPELQHHDALTGRGRPLLEPFVKGHRDTFSLKPQIQHHDSLTGLSQPGFDPFIKGHRSDPPPLPMDRSLKRLEAVDTAALPLSDEVPLCKISGDQCLQFVLKSENRQWQWLAASFGGFQEGTCWGHGYNINDGSQETSMPLIGKANMRLFKKPNIEMLNVDPELFTQTSTGVISMLAVALMSLVGVSGAIFAVLQVRRATCMAGKEALLAA